MNRCPITYERCGSHLYSINGLKLLDPILSSLKPIEYTAIEQRDEAYHRSTKMSIPGVQPKLSAVLDIKNERFEIVGQNGTYILKPQHNIYPEFPENEDLTMRMAQLIGIEVPFHGLIHSKDNTFTYFIKRFDRYSHKTKIPVEDFSQLAGLNRENKYDYSMEKLVTLIDTYCTFPAIEKAKLFKIVVFNFLTGNEDMHLKNYSLISRDNKIELSPVYDLLNTSIVLSGDIDEIGLFIAGTKKQLNYEILINYFGKELCGLPEKVIDNILKTISKTLPQWDELIKMSFLSAAMKRQYAYLFGKRLRVLAFR
jgi:serine/threonine-protein kinase HipA